MVSPSHRALPNIASPSRSPTSPQAPGLHRHTSKALVLAASALAACLCVWAGVFVFSESSSELEPALSPELDASAFPAQRQLSRAVRISQERTNTSSSSSGSSSSSWKSLSNKGLSQISGAHNLGSMLEQHLSSMMVPLQTVQPESSEFVDCGSRLKIPKIALMFLTRGPMPLEDIWEAWCACTLLVIFVISQVRRTKPQKQEYVA